MFLSIKLINFGSAAAARVCSHQWRRCRRSPNSCHSLSFVRSQRCVSDKLTRTRSLSLLRRTAAAERKYELLRYKRKTSCIFAYSKGTADFVSYAIRTNQRREPPGKCATRTTACGVLPRLLYIYWVHGYCAIPQCVWWRLKNKY